MKSVKEIKQVFEDWQREDIPTDDLIVTMVDALIGITEHLEAQPERSDDAIRREAMIETLRWVIDRMPTGRSTIAAALERIENGGDL